VKLGTMRKKNTELLSDVILQVLKEQHLDKPLNEKRLIDAWPLVLGDNIMKYTSGLSIKNRILYVTLTSSVLRHDLFLSREQIKNSLNKQVGVEVIVDIVFR
jgi:predicted nucleic acid-binding Zn ribbon protein